MTNYDKIHQDLLQKRSELELRISKIKQDYSAILNRDSQEQAVELENSEVLNALDEEAARELDQVKIALQRLENNEYGSCTDCGITIPDERLEAIPYALYCVNCAAKH